MNGFLKVGSRAVGVIGCAVPECGEPETGLMPLRISEGQGLAVHMILCHRHRAMIDADGTLTTLVTAAELRKAEPLRSVG